ncbi:acyl-CoA dehydrogenase [Leeia aquatica]|uniref:3-methylmercaptopropionyl-CoA dehydrogenase n=1 Tax=Leeia aquatica TaxID=2725557 RepID=A0A847SFW9_9NEIS|nr:acyl-CoA dehydrogenase [Leeia aquatica]NLR76128.1 acyl-CoA dehydrogenase [Leeia aquatica]
MTAFATPVRDMLFALKSLTDFDQVARLPGYEEATAELADAVFEEAGKFANGVLAHLNQPGDVQGAQWSDYQVKAADGFAEAYRQFVEAGWNSLGGDTAFGGQGLPAAISVAVNEMWCAANLSYSLLPLLTQGAIESLHHHASDALKATYLHKMVEGVWTGTMNLTEPQAGSDLSQVRSKAVPEGEHYRISGQKIFITWGEHDCAENIIHLVLARLPDAPAGVKGISLFVVPKYLVGADGALGARNDVRCVSIEHKLGIHASPTCVMQFGEQGGAIGYLVGEPNRGLEYMFTMMNHARLGVGVEGVAIAERAYQQAVWYARDRVQSRELGGSNPAPVAIIRHPDIRRMLMSMRSQIEAMRALSYVAAVALDMAAVHPDAAAQKQQQALVDFLIPIVKAWSTEQAQEITYLGVQIHGGMGFIEETGAAQFMRDARITTIYEGTTGIQALDLIGRKLARDGGATARAVLAMAAADAEKARACGETGARVADALQAALKLAQQSSDWMVVQFSGQPRAAAAGAVPYLKLMGTVLGGMMMARQVVAATQQRDSDPAWFDAKLATARFYAEHSLPLVSGLHVQVTGGAESVLLMDDAQF